ncbi:MAG: GGDEF domain-containing protein [Solirubrobacteraceae bacterium]
MGQSFLDVSRRLLRPIPDIDGPAQRAWMATRPSRRAAAHGLGWQFLAGAAVAASLPAFVPGSASNPALLLGVAAIAFAIGIALRLSVDAGEHAIDRSITAAIPLVVAAVMVVRPMELTPMLLLWPMLLGAHYALPRRVAANAALALVTLAAALATTADAHAPIATFVIFTVVSLGATVAYRRVRAEAARLFAELEELSSHDALTGALNKPAFERAFQAWAGNGVRRQLDSALLLVDIDHFKRINDVHGHQAGDAALGHLATIVYECIRETDAFGRLEGDEFGVLFPATAGPQAMLAAERIRATVAQRSAELGIPFTISIGVTGGQTFSDPWDAAARALALAKAAGTNRVVLAETETEWTSELHELPHAA